MSVVDKSRFETNVAEMWAALCPLTEKLLVNGIEITSPYDYRDVLLRDRKAFRIALPWILEFFTSTESAKVKECLASVLSPTWASPEAFGPLRVEFCKEGTSENVRREIAGALETIVVRDDMPELLPTYFDKRYG